VTSTAPVLKPLSLSLVLVLSKSLAVAEHDLPPSWWLLPLLFWDDVAAGCALYLLDRLVGRRWLTSAVYWAVILWAVINIPVVRALGSPLTWPMLEAAGGPLYDSIVHYLTFGNLLRAAMVLAAGAALPLVLWRLPGVVRTGMVVAGMGLAVAGLSAAVFVDAYGFERNAITALVRTALPRVVARESNGDWRETEVGLRQVDLSSWRGAGAGRHVVLVILESTAAQYLRPFGARLDPTPHLTALAGSSLLFERAYAVYPESVKGLFATLCARAPAFDVPVEAHARTACAALPRLLAERGYRTGLFHSGRFSYLGMDTLVTGMGYGTLEDAGAIGGHVESSFGVDDRATVERILAWIDERPVDRPFFVTYMPTAGHHPYATTGPGPFTEPGDFGAYLNALHEGDQALGRLVAGLRERRLGERTLFVIMGDHGEAFGQHPGNYGHSLGIHDENVRVPLMFALPGIAGPPSPIPDVASSIDVAPTVLDLLGVETSMSAEGVSLLDRRARSALFFTDYSRGLVGLQDGCWNYQLDLDASRSRLFDTCRETGETIDRTSEQVGRIRAYEARLRGWVGAIRGQILNRRTVSTGVDAAKQ
jgi:hypothetical protein